MGNRVDEKNESFWTRDKGGSARARTRVFGELLEASGMLNEIFYLPI